MKKDNILKTAWYIFFIGILFDVMTTIIGFFIGLQELHPSGFLFIFIANALIIIISIFAYIYRYKYIEKYTLIASVLIPIGIFRLSIGIINIITIIDVM